MILEEYLKMLFFLHLRRKYQEIFYFNKRGECDFVIMNKNQVAECIQVCWQVDDMNMKREINGLISALNFFGLSEGVIVTHDQTDFFEIEGISIKLIPSWEYMGSG